MIGLPTSVTSKISPRATPASAAASPISAFIALAHAVGELHVAARIHHHIGDAAHQVFAEADLRVHRTDRGDNRAADEIAEMRCDRGRADVDRDAIGALREAGP